MRRPVAAVAGVALVAVTLVIAFVNLVLGLAVKRQSMSLGGLAPSAMSTGAWVAGGLLGLYLLCCAGICVRAAVTDRTPGRLGRLLLVVCAVAHGVLGAAVVGMVGWLAFAVLMVVLGLLVATLILYAPAPVPPPAAADNGAAFANPTSP
jgi:hypothetical protein